MRAALVIFVVLALARCDRRMDDLQLLKDCPHTTIWIDNAGQKWVGIVPYSDYVSRVSSKADIAEICR